MDYRTPLKSQTVLDFDGIGCHVEEVAGCGSNAVVYRGWYPDNLNPQLRHHVLIKELFPAHPDRKIWRGEQGCIEVDPEALPFWQDHRRSFAVGNDIHLRLLAAHPDMVGANLNSYSLNGTLYSVLGYTGGRSLETELAGTGTDLMEITRRMLGILDALEAFHESGYLHLDISPENIMLMGSGGRERIFLIDYNSACPVGSAGNGQTSCRHGYSAPELETGSWRSLGYASDLYAVAAVFYRCLMGRSLTLEERLMRRAPDAKTSAYLAEVPQTVRSMVVRILRKGLNTLPGERYQSIDGMRRAFLELTDRIERVGVTHWALWENGRRSVEELIRVNPSLYYLTAENGLYPIRLEEDSGTVSLKAYLEKTMAPGGASGLLLAQGGMGKTTLLLHTAMLQGKRYSNASPAVFYISLRGWNGADPCFIRKKILMSLRFKPGMNTFETALHALQKLLEQPLRSQKGELPVVLLLLDGLNEIQGDPGALIQEINDLTRLAGVRIIAASRSAYPNLMLKQTALAPLEPEDVASVLEAGGLLIPGDRTVLQLLRTPLILSLYVRASEAGKQPDIHSEAELVKTYMDALYRKEAAQLPESAPERWQMDAALCFVLPCIAAACGRTGGALTEQQLLKVIGRCRRALQGGTLIRIFPRWTGHSREILGDTGTAEQWYGLMIHTLLWQRLGLLMKDPDGGYSVFHHRIAVNLAEEGQCLTRRIRWTGGLAAAGVTAAAACLILLAGTALMPRSYDEKKTEQAIDAVAVCYSAYGARVSELQSLTEYLTIQDMPEFMSGYARCADSVRREAELTVRESGYLTQISELCESADQVAWSRRPLDGEKARTMVSDASLLMEEYLTYLPLLEGWARSELAQTECPDFPEVFRRLLDADALIMSKLYYQTCVPHLEGGAPLWSDAIRENIASVPQSGREPEESLEKLCDDRDAVQAELVRIAASVRLICGEDNLLNGD